MNMDDFYSPLQRSILYERDFKLSQMLSTAKPLASDDIINVYDLSDGLFITTWKVNWLILSIIQSKYVMRTHSQLNVKLHNNVQKKSYFVILASVLPSYVWLYWFYKLVL